MSLTYGHDEEHEEEGVGHGHQRRGEGRDDVAQGLEPAEDAHHLRAEVGEEPPMKMHVRKKRGCKALTNSELCEALRVQELKRCLGRLV